MRDLDLALFERIHSLAGTHAVLDAVMAFSSQYSPQLYAVILVLLWLRWCREGQRAAGIAVSATVVALGVGLVVETIFRRDRPFVALHFTPLIPHAVNPSFPSDHVLLAFAVTVVLTRMPGVGRGGRSLLWLLAATVSISRIYVGAHYPSDVLGGAIIGSGAALGTLWLMTAGPLGRFPGRVLDVLSRLHLAAAGSEPPANAD